MNTLCCLFRVKHCGKEKVAAGGKGRVFVVPGTLVRAIVEKLIRANANINILMPVRSTDMEMYGAICFSTKQCCKLGFVSNGTIMLAVIANY